MQQEQQVVQALQALYSPATSPAQKSQANHWLTAFQHSAEAWQVPFALLTAEQAQEVQFFATTLLVRKVRSEWTKLDAGSRQGLGQACRAKFQEALTWQPPLGELVLRQQCALLAALCGAAGGDGANELATQALQLLQTGSPVLALQLLTALAQEAEDLDRVRRLALVNVLAPRGREVLGALGALLAAASQQVQRGGGGGAEGPAIAALKCAEAWLELSPTGGSGCMLSPGEVQAQQGQLLASALALLAHPSSSDAVVEAAAQLLLLVFGLENFAADEQADLAATSALAQALLATRGRLAGADSDTLPAAVSKLASAAAERAPEHVCRHMPQAVELSELVLECLSRPGPELAAHSVDFLLMANTVSLSERPPALRQPLYEATLQRLVPHASFPTHFTSWAEEFEVDEDAFKRLREQHLPELLDVCYGLLRIRYLQAAWQLLQGAASWQAAEAALYLFSSVSLAVKSRVLAETNVGDENAAVGSRAAAALEDRAQTHALLTALFARVCSQEGAASMLGAHPMLAEAACRLVEHYAAWFGREGEEPPLQGALQLLLRALSIPQASHTAAQGFQQVCLRCAGKIRDAGAFGWLMDAAHGALQQAGSSIPIAERQLVVEGLARAAAGLPGQHLLDASARLAAPFVQSAQQACSNGAAADAAARRTLADSLRLLASVVRHLAPVGDEQGGLGTQPAAQIMAAAGPTLAAVAESPAWQADREAVGAVIEVYQRAVGTAREHLQLVMQALSAMTALFAATIHPGCLEVVVDALEMQYEEAGMPAAAMQALVAACNTALPGLQNEDQLQEHPALVSSLLSLAHACAVYAPAALWTSPALPALLQLAAAAVRLREADPVAHALELISRLAFSHERADEEGITPAHLQAVHSVLAAHGEALVAALLAAECDSCPRHLMRNAADCVRRLLANPSLRQLAAGWVAAAASGGQLPGCSDGHLTPDDCATFAALLPQLAGLRFNALVVDFGLLARGQNTNDVLLAYEL